MDKNSIERFKHINDYAVDPESRTLFLVGDISSPNVETLVQNMFLLNQISDKEITIHINSFGGTDEMMFFLYDVIRNSKSPVTTIGSGFVCSAAALIFVSANKRVATENCWFMTHKGKVTLDGDTDEIAASAEVTKMLSDRYWDLLARHTKKTSKWWHENSKCKGELWLDPKDMLRYGVADLVLNNENGKQKKQGKKTSTARS